MAQLINLYTPVRRTQRRGFSARVMAQALAALLMLAVLLGLYELFDLHRQSQALTQTLQTQLLTLGALDLTTRQSQAAVMPAELALAQDLAARRAELLRLDNALADVQQGVFRPGEGHGARLALVARSIPATAWVTLVKVDAGRFEVSGFTFEPGALNAWIEQLAASPLLKGQRLAAVNVTKINEAAVAAPAPGLSTGAGASGAPAEPPARPVWSFTLVNAPDQPLAVPGEAP